jgi:hypothetical protein
VIWLDDINKLNETEGDKWNEKMKSTGIYKEI